MGRTRRREWGFPYFRSGLGRGSIDPTTALGFLVVGLAMAALGAATALWGVPDLGVISELPGGQVLYVQPGSFAWQEGIRVGQTVLALRSSDSPGGGGITTEADGLRIGASMNAAAAHMRDGLSVALFALALAALAVVAFPWRLGDGRLQVGDVGLQRLPSSRSRGDPGVPPRWRRSGSSSPRYP